ncbi:MAG: hypothetical protein KJZ86_03265 [Caldilineaceae bacterium]|nr:hypothetical protein [Caldilineaceae bacterium]HRJ42638.1 hypothetical protein [Caldilineaceae bacterium]
MNARSAGWLLLILPFLLFSYQPAQSGADALGLATAEAIATTIPIQGSLRNSQGAVNGPCDLRFALYNASQGGERVGALLTQTLTVTDGIFNTNADFGDVWDGNSRWLQIEVRCPSSSGSFVALSPRQPIQATPYALRARLAENALSAAYAQQAKVAEDAWAASGTFTSGGGLRSAIPGGVSDDGGYLELVNTTSNDTWQLVIRGTPEDQLSFAFYDAAGDKWYDRAILSRDGLFWARSHIIAGGDLTAQNGLLRSTRQADQYNGGLLELENGTNGNKWQIPIRTETGDSLSFLYLDAATQQWRRVGNLDKEGQLTIQRKSDADGTLLGLDHPKVHWRFAIDPSGHPEMGIYDVAKNITRWNVLDIDTGTGNVAINGDARPDEFNFMVHGQAAITTSFASNTSLLQLLHPKSRLIFHVDVDGHPEIGLYSTATDQTVWNVLDFDPVTGHTGVGGIAPVNEQLKVYGDFTATGTKAATVDLGAYGQRKFYASEAADVRFSDEGIATLNDGEVRVALDPVFVAAIEQPYIIHLTPYADAVLYVAEIQADGFLVKAREGDGNASFAWRLSAPRQGYADVRLEEVGEKGDSP